MLGWLYHWLGSQNVPSAPIGTETGARVIHDDSRILLMSPDGHQEIVLWSSLERVTIETTDAGPFVSDLFWILDTAEGRSYMISMGSPGEAELLSTMQHRLHGFDNMAVVEAMGSTEVARFQVWAKPE